MKTNVFQVTALSLILSASLAHAMQMGDGQSLKQSTQAKKSCLNTCCDVTRKCCYLSAALCLMTSGQSVNGHPDDIECYKAFEYEEIDHRNGIGIAFYQIILNPNPEIDRVLQSRLEIINERNAQREACASRMKKNRRAFCNKRVGLGSRAEDHQAWDRLAEEEVRLGDYHPHVAQERERLETNYYTRKGCLALLKDDQEDDDYEW